MAAARKCDRLHVRGVCLQSAPSLTQTNSDWTDSYLGQAELGVAQREALVHGAVQVMLGPAVGDEGAVHLRGGHVQFVLLEEEKRKKSCDQFSDQSSPSVGGATENNEELLRDMWTEDGVPNETLDSNERVKD